MDRLDELYKSLLFMLGLFVLARKVRDVHACGSGIQVREGLQCIGVVSGVFAIWR